MKTFVTILIFTFFAINCYSQTITASPGWSYSVSSGTVAEAGSDYTTDPSSAASQTLVSFSGFSIFASYRVSVHKSDTDWNSGLDVQVLRTGAGSSNGFGGSISGGSAFITLTNSPQTFFTGSTSFSTGRNNVPIQYQIQGLSVLLPVKTYTTTIVYTVSN